jgi:type VI secretion system secreted protein VgrG
VAGRSIRARATVGEQELVALEVSLHEALGELGRAEVLLVLGDDDTFALGPAEAIGAPALVELSDEAGDLRRLAGEVVSARVERSGAHATRLALVVRPRLARLELRTDCRRFQGKTATEVARVVLEGAGYASDEIELRLASELEARASYAQYRETDWAFLSRVLAEAGLWCFALSDGERDRVVLSDGDLGDVEPKELRAIEGDGLAGESHAVFGLSRTRRILPGKVTSLVHDFERPKLDPTSTVTLGSAREAALEVFTYPVRSTNDAEVERAATVRAEACDARRVVVRGSTSSLHLGAGYRANIVGHAYEPLNGEVLLVASSLRWSRQGGARSEPGREELHASFEAIPIEGRRLWPLTEASQAPARGLSSAHVCGAPGLEIDPDAMGRVVAKPVWDRTAQLDQSASPRMRAMQLPLGESMLTPRVGWEVLVGGWYGDADDPLVVGRMVFGAMPPTYGLPGGKNKLSIQTPTTPGGGSSNELRFDDSAGSEQMYFNASKNMSQKVGNNATVGVTANETRTVGANRELAVLSSYEMSVTSAHTITIGASQTVGVTSYLVDDVGSHAHAIGGSRNMSVGGDAKMTSSGACSVSVGGTCLELVVGTVSTQLASTFGDTVGAVRVDLCAGKRVVKVAAAYAETIGAAKVILAGGGVATSAASLARSTGGAVAIVTKGDHEEKASGSYTEAAGGAHVIQASNVVFKAESLLSVVMGGSTITLTPGSVTIAGATIKIDAPSDQLGLVRDN